MIKRIVIEQTIIKCDRCGDKRVLTAADEATVTRWLRMYGWSFSLDGQQHFCPDCDAHLSQDLLQKMRSEASNA